MSITHHYFLEESGWFMGELVTAGSLPLLFFRLLTHGPLTRHQVLHFVLSLSGRKISQVSPEEAAITPSRSFLNKFLLQGLHCHIPLDQSPRTLVTLRALGLFFLKKLLLAYHSLWLYVSLFLLRRSQHPTALQSLLNLASQHYSVSSASIVALSGALLLI